MTRPGLMRHQMEGVSFLSRRDCAALLMDRGTGKTATVLVEASDRIRRGEVQSILYVAPLSTLQNVADEARRFTGNIDPVLLVGSRAKRVNLIKKSRANLFIINFEGCRIIAKELLERGFDEVIVDESSRIKERRTQVSRALAIIGSSARYRRILTGMPFTEGVEDAWSQFNFLSPEILHGNFYAFKNRYCVMQSLNFGGKRFNKIMGYRNLDEFEKKIMPYIYRVAKEDALDLPPKTYQVLKVKMLTEQKKQYEKVKKQAFSEIGDEEITHAVALAKIQKLRQVAAGFVYTDTGDPIIVPTAKYQELVSLMDDTLYGSKKMVVFTSFRAEPEMVEDAIAGMKRKVKCFRLPVDPLGRQPTINEWTEWNESPAVLVCNARSGGTGLNLTAADTAVFISNDWRMEDRAQAEDRIHRIGSEVFSKVTIVDIVVEDTVEEMILEALKRKKDLVDLFLESIRQHQKHGPGRRPK